MHFHFDLGLIPPDADLDFEIELVNIEMRDYVKTYPVGGGPNNAEEGQKLPEEMQPEFLGVDTNPSREL